MHPHSAFISQIVLLVPRYISEQVTALKHSDSFGRFPRPSHGPLMPLRCHGITPLSSSCHSKAKVSPVLGLQMLHRCHSYIRVSKVAHWRSRMIRQVGHYIPPSVAVSLSKHVQRSIRNHSYGCVECMSL